MAAVRRIRRAHEWLGVHMPATRVFVYFGAALTAFMWLVITVAAVRRGLHGLPAWSPRMGPAAVKSLVPPVVCALLGLPLDWAARRARWWAHALAGAVLGVLLVAVKGAEKLSRDGAAVDASALIARMAPAAGFGAVLFSALFVITYLGTRGSKPPPDGRATVWERGGPGDRPRDEAARPRFTEREFTDWSRAWAAAQRRAARPTNLVMLAGLVGGTALWLLVLRHVMSGRGAMLVHVGILFACMIVGLRLQVRASERVQRELGRMCHYCGSVINNPQAVIRAGGKCVHCEHHVYAPAV